MGAGDPRLARPPRHPLVAKHLATLLLAISAGGGLLTLAEPWRYVPLAVSVVVLGWMWTRPSC